MKILRKYQTVTYVCLKTSMYFKLSIQNKVWDRDRNSYLTNITYLIFALYIGDATLFLQRWLDANMYVAREYEFVKVYIFKAFTDINAMCC